MKALVVVVAAALCAAGAAQGGSRWTKPSSGRAAAGDGTGATQPRAEFKHSTKPPYYMVRSTSIPFWDFGASTVITEDYIRLTPSIRNRSGWLWNKRPASMRAWEVTFNLKITGSKRTGSNGIAFWYTEQSRTVGQAYGSADDFKGLGLFLDTFDNSGVGDGSPVIAAMVGDGKQQYDPATDGIVRPDWTCRRPYRNTGYQYRVRVRYQNNRVTISTSENPHADFEACFVMDDIELPTGYFFGFSASTGQVADMHDIYAVQTFDLEPMSYDEILDQMKNKRTQQNEDADGDDAADGDAVDGEAADNSASESTPENDSNRPSKTLSGTNAADTCNGLSQQLAAVYHEVKVLRKDMDALVLAQESLREISTLQAEINKRISDDFGKTYDRMDTLSSKVSEESNEVASAVSELKTYLHGHSDELSSIKNRVLNDDKHQVMGNVARELETLKKSLSGSDRDSKRLVDNLEKRLNELNDSIESSSSSTMWTFVILVAVVVLGFGAFFMYNERNMRKQLFL